MVGNAASLSALIAEDASFVEHSGAERAALDTVVASFKALAESTASGSASFQDSAATRQFADTFAKLAGQSQETVTEGGVSFADLNAFVTRSFNDNAQIVQRIADKALNEKRAAQEAAAREAEEEKKRQKQEREAAQAAKLAE